MKDRLNDVIISSHNLELTPALKQIVLDKVEKLFEHESHIIRIRVELCFESQASREKAFVAKGHIEIKGKPMICTEQTNDLYKSIDQLVIKLDRMRRRRARRRVLERKHPRDIEIPAQIPKTQMA